MGIKKEHNIVRYCTETNHICIHIYIYVYVVVYVYIIIYQAQQNRNIQSQKNTDSLINNTLII
jgi:preprotein translocase subunit YajC